jgi:hypothetical protein
VAIRLTFRDHVVIAGLGTVGSVLAAKLQEAGYRVVAIELASANEAVGRARDQGIRVLIGSALDPAVVRGAHVAKASHVVVVTGEDESNLDVVAAVRTLLPERGERVLTVFVQLDDRSLWRMLRTEAFGIARHPNLRVEFFNVFEIAAPRLLERHPPLERARDGAPRKANVLIVGFEGVAPSLVPAILRQWLSSERHPAVTLRITIVDSDAEQWCARLRSQHPELPELCELAALPLHTLSPAFQRGVVALDVPRDYELGTIYVCRTPDTRALSTAFALSTRPETDRAAIVVALLGIRSGVATSAEPSQVRPGRLEIFNVLASAVGPDLLHCGTNEQIAQTTHATYVRAARERRLTEADNPSLVAWDRLPESVKQSNRQFADRVGHKLQAAHCRLVPASLTPSQGLQFSEAEVEELCRLGHEQWAADLHREGWHLTTGGKDSKRKLHPMLIPWAELSEYQREQNRVLIRALPDSLARAGFEIVRGAGETEESDSRPSDSRRTVTEWAGSARK